SHVPGGALLSGGWQRRAPLLEIAPCPPISQKFFHAIAATLSASGVRPPHGPRAQAWSRTQRPRPARAAPAVSAGTSGRGAAPSANRRVRTTSLQLELPTTSSAPERCD